MKFYNEYIEPAWLSLARQTNSSSINSQKRVDGIRQKETNHKAEDIFKNSAKFEGNSSVSNLYKLTTTPSKLLNTKTESPNSRLSLKKKSSNSFKSAASINGNKVDDKPTCPKFSLFDSNETHSRVISSTSLESALNSARRLIDHPNQNTLVKFKESITTSSVTVKSKTPLKPKLDKPQLKTDTIFNTRMITRKNLKYSMKQSLPESSSCGKKNSLKKKDFPNIRPKNKLKDSEIIKVPESYPSKIALSKVDLNNSISKKNYSKLTAKSNISQLKKTVSSFSKTPSRSKVFITTPSLSSNHGSSVTNDSPKIFSDCIPPTQIKKSSNRSKSENKPSKKKNIQQQNHLAKENEAVENKWNKKILKAFTNAISKFPLSESNYWELVANELRSYGKYTGEECALKFDELEQKKQKRKPKPLKIENIDLPVKGNTRKWKMDQIMHIVHRNENSNSNYETPRFIQNLKDEDREKVQTTSTARRKSIPLWMLARTHLEELGSDFLAEIESAKHSPLSKDDIEANFDADDIPEESLKMHRFIQKHRKKREEVIKYKMKNNITPTVQPKDDLSITSNELSKLIINKQKDSNIEEIKELRQALLWTAENPDEDEAPYVTEELLDLAKIYEVNDFTP